MPRHLLLALLGLACSIPITTPDELQLMQGSSGSFELANDLVFTKPMAMISGFSGTFDGNGYTIHNFNATSHESKFGMFVSSPATVKNLKIKFSLVLKFSGDVFLGVISPLIEATMTLKDIELEGSIHATGMYPYIGCFVGRSIQSWVGTNLVARCDLEADVTMGLFNLGGIATMWSGTLTSCAFIGSIRVRCESYVTSANVGGLVGERGGVSNCFANITALEVESPQKLRFGALQANGETSMNSFAIVDTMKVAITKKASSASAMSFVGGVAGQFNGDFVSAVYAKIGTLTIAGSGSVHFGGVSGELIVFGGVRHTFVEIGAARLTDCASVTGIAPFGANITNVQVEVASLTLDGTSPTVFYAISNAANTSDVYVSVEVAEMSASTTAYLLGAADIVYTGVVLAVSLPAAANALVKNATEYRCTGVYFQETPGIGASAEIPLGVTRLTAAQMKTASSFSLAPENWTLADGSAPRLRKIPVKAGAGYVLEDASVWKSTVWTIRGDEIFLVSVPHCVGLGASAASACLVCADGLCSVCSGGPTYLDGHLCTPFACLQSQSRCEQCLDAKTCYKCAAGSIFDLRTKGSKNCVTGAECVEGDTATASATECTPRDCSAAGTFGAGCVQCTAALCRRCGPLQFLDGREGSATKDKCIPACPAETCKPEGSPDTGLACVEKECAGVPGCTLCDPAAESKCVGCGSPLLPAHGGDACLPATACQTEAAYKVAGCTRCNAVNPDKCDECAEGFAHAPAEKTCVPCISGCKECGAGTPAVCDLCLGTHYAEAGLCKEFKSCPPSLPGCVLCKQDDATCVTCAPGHVLVGAACKAGRQCAADPGIAGCLYCTEEDAALCAACAAGTKLSSDRRGCLAPGACRADASGYQVGHCEACDDAVPDKCARCAPEFVVDAAGKKCEPCIAHCAECALSSLETCVACAADYFPTADTRKCVPANACLQGELLVAGCAECGANPEACEACSPGHVLSPGDNACLACMENCAECPLADRLAKCSVCAGGHLLHSQETGCLVPAACTLEGPDKVPDCAECDGTHPDRCRTCAGGYGYLADSNSCAPCPPECSLCTEPASGACTGCAEGYFLQEGACVTAAPCAEAPANCSLCLSDGRTCAECAAGHVLVGGQCHPGKPCAADPQIPDCLYCTAEDPTLCAACGASKSLHSGKAACIAPDACAREGDADFVAHCAECDPAHADVCRACLAGYSQDGAACVARKSNRSAIIGGSVAAVVVVAAGAVGAYFLVRRLRQKKAGSAAAARPAEEAMQPLASDLLERADKA